MRLARLGAPSGLSGGAEAPVAQGLSNPQIGQRLSVSRRSVQTHLAHVFAKLNVTSRASLPPKPPGIAGNEGHRSPGMAASERNQIGITLPFPYLLFCGIIAWF